MLAAPRYFVPRVGAALAASRSLSRLTITKKKPVERPHIRMPVSPSIGASRRQP